jgi:hypothetical protein
MNCGRDPSLPWSHPASARGREEDDDLNDGILQQAFARARPVLDLRLICSEDRDYANAIEPSVQEGEKIATAIVGWMAGHDLRPARNVILTR